MRQQISGLSFWIEGHSAPSLHPRVPSKIGRFVVRKAASPSGKLAPRLGWVQSSEQLVRHLCLRGASVAVEALRAIHG